MRRESDHGGYVLIEALLVVALSSALTVVFGARVGAEFRVMREQVAELAWQRQYAVFALDARAASERVELPFWCRRHEEVVSDTGGALSVGYTDGVAARHLEVVAAEAGARGKGVAVELRVGEAVVARLAGLESAQIAPWVGGDDVLWGLVVNVSRGNEWSRRLYLRFGTPGGTI